VTTVNVSGTNKRESDGQIDKPEMDSKKINIKDFCKGKNKFYDCNHFISFIQYSINPPRWM
jgi:hypothetical protein